MFFRDKIKNINESDYVLEIGPGGHPHPRADILLEKRFPADISFEQNGHASPLVTDKPIIFYEGDKFPFEDNEFDYVICSHVLEHISADDFPLFISEIQRIAKRGYIEFPTVYYDYIYNFPMHTTFLMRKENKLFFMPKMKTELLPFKDIQKFFYHTADLGYISLINDLQNYFFQGFEWENEISIQATTDISDISYGHLEMQNVPSFQKNSFSTKKRIIERIKTIPKKIVPNLLRLISNKFNYYRKLRFHSAASRWFADRGDETLRLEYDLDENSIVFDVGGYQGDFAKSIFNKYRSNIYIFEPVPRYFRLLTTIFRNNPKIKIFNFGLSSKDEKVSFRLERNASSNHISSGEVINVELRDMIQFLETEGIHKIDLLKLNIEGGEFTLLENLIRKNKITIIKNLQIQFHLFIKSARARRRKIQRHLKRTHSLTYNYFFIWENWKSKIK